MQPKLWKMHPGKKLSPVVSCHTPSTLNSLTRFGQPVFPELASRPQQSAQQLREHQGQNHFIHDGQRSPKLTLTDESTQRDMVVIRSGNGYSNVDAFEAELEMERERSQTGYRVEELAIPVQPRKQGSENNRNQPETWKRPTETSNAPLYAQARYIVSSSATTNVGNNAALSQKLRSGGALSHEEQLQYAQRYNLRSNNGVPSNSILSGVTATRIGANVPRAVLSTNPQIVGHTGLLGRYTTNGDEIEDDNGEYHGVQPNIGYRSQKANTSSDYSDYQNK